MATSKPPLTRIWASNAPSNRVIDPDTTETNKYINGFTVERPFYEHFNFIFNKITQALLYNNEQGINEWDSTTTYPLNAFVKGTDGNLYKALLEQAGNNPVGDGGTNWATFSSGGGGGFDGLTDNSVPFVLSDVAVEDTNFNYNPATDTLSTPSFSSTGITDAAGLLSLDLLDNNANALTIAQGANDYLKIDTTNTSESMTYGNAATSDLDHVFLGGNLGLGTSSIPLDGAGDGVKALTISADASGSFPIAYNNLQGFRTGAFQFNGSIDFYAGTDRNARIIFANGSDTTAGELLFFTATGGSLAEAMRVKSNGNLAVGLNSADFRLHSLAPAGIPTAAIFETLESNSNIAFQDSTTSSNISVRIGSIGDDFRIFTNNSEALRVDSSGNLVIGATATAGGANLYINRAVGEIHARLETGDTSDAYINLRNSIGSWIVGTTSYDSGTTDSFRLRDSTANADRFIINGDGDIGVGSSTPTGRFNAAIQPTTSATTVNETSDFVEKFVIGTTVLGVNGDRIPLVFNLGSNTQDHISAAIVAERESSGWNTALSFWTNNITSGPDGVDAIQQKMILTSNGNLGLGTNSPLELLHINNASGNAVIQLQCVNGGISQLSLGDQADRDIGRLRYDHALEAISLFASNTEYLRSSTPAAGETSLWLYDADNATLERVTVGAADSGGTGFKVLRIPN